jgi:hypothetical protein
VFALFLSVSLQAQNQEIKSSRDFFEAFHAKDTVQLKGLCDETMILQSISENAKGIKLSMKARKLFLKSVLFLKK